MTAIAATHGGRLLGYTLVGAMVGLGGGLLAGFLALAGLNQALRWISVGVLAATGLSIAGWLPAPHLADRALAWAAIRLPTPRQGPLRPLLLGLSWSLMPCGMVYFALFNASFTGSPVRAAAYMAAFGLGTLPALTAVSWSGAAVFRWRGRASLTQPTRRVLGLLLVVLAPLSALATEPGFLGGICTGH